jgi:hypothetical protein
MTPNHLLPPFLDPADVAIQTKIRLPLPIVLGNKDYREREKQLRRMDEILLISGVEDHYIHHAVMVEREPGVTLTDRRRMSIQRQAKIGLRCTLARILSNESHRTFSTHLAESALLQWFCGCDNLGTIRVPAKSTLQRMEAAVPAEFITSLNQLMVINAGHVDESGNSVLRLDIPVDLSLIWIDATCAKLDIHYPVDWTLLRDGTRSIMRSILVIRRHGLKHRMPTPESFTTAMNQHAMAMSASSRRGRGGDKARSRKRVLRLMKLVAHKVIQHGQRYRDLLQASWNLTDLSQAQAQVIIDRIDRILSAMPTAISQAHERIIGERVVPNDDKILSFYEPHAAVYVRGKAGADAEFGLQMLLSESAEGLIVDCHLVPERIASDSSLLIPALKRMRAAYGPTVAGAVITDRGFSSEANSSALGKLGIIDCTLPRSPEAMGTFLKDASNRELQRRRGQIEARIGIFKANFLGTHLPTKGLLSQTRFVAWATVAHNLWVLSRLECVRDVAALAA